ncbi:hypothetical protein ERO13_A12G081100v2 [Gossypium hirsutum]|nr:NAD kinase 2, chloroplastic-like [Gossypium hirsutum]KAB2051987.1 hypothetical protein ES319_A12G089400v1 [Gossypium barbadense]TYG89392.1 hypothetical protein ES288_A12G096700v1 [Gossypium darwinii]TYH95304.1 hypothetical protein ES332_A12G097300v1 [Gossypium tomentosum]TYJ04425.1 hypothetical protein E1A91_A12G091600v1 [Gossypium mustelinum]KAB2051988.1 hypothetical protein ES319_A12G089400v1 [Gossypium barbadense]
MGNGALFGASYIQKTAQSHDVSQLQWIGPVPGDIPEVEAYCEIEFWRGGQVTEEGLKWLIDRGFKTIVDLRAETVKDNFYQSALDDAILSEKVDFLFCI